MSLPEADWLALCRRAGTAARDAVASYSTRAERSVETGVGEGGDMSYVIDRAAEDAIFGELTALDMPVTAVSEERGEVPIAGGGPARVVIDPVDGSLNAKRGVPFSAVSIAVASGGRMGDVEVGWVAELAPAGPEGGEPGVARDWWAVRGEGACLAGEALSRLEPGPLEILGLETARPPLLRRAAAAIAELEARRIRALGSVALTLCHVAAGHLDAMISLRPVRSVDVAAAQLIVTECGGAVAFPGGDTLDLSMRSHVAAARDEATVERLVEVLRRD
jgi:myo-inositol-1(or 4)-monophosphatase